jgi:hypothetical protein
MLVQEEPRMMWNGDSRSGYNTTIMLAQDASVTDVWDCYLVGFESRPYDTRISISSEYNLDFCFWTIFFWSGWRLVFFFLDISLFCMKMRIFKQLA